MGVPVGLEIGFCVDGLINAHRHTFINSNNNK